MGSTNMIPHQMPSINTRARAQERNQELNIGHSQAGSHIKTPLLLLLLVTAVAVAAACVAGS